MKPLVCVDCKWSMHVVADIYNCKASETIHLVTGRPEYQYCNVMRLDSQPCGTNAKLFELNQSDMVSYD